MRLTLVASTNGTTPTRPRTLAPRWHLSSSFACVFGTWCDRFISLNFPCVLVGCVDVCQCCLGESKADKKRREKKALKERKKRERQERREQRRQEKETLAQKEKDEAAARKREKRAENGGFFAGFLGGNKANKAKASSANPQRQGKPHGDEEHEEMEEDPESLLHLALGDAPLEEASTPAARPHKRRRVPTTTPLGVRTPRLPGHVVSTKSSKQRPHQHRHRQRHSSTPDDSACTSASAASGSALDITVDQKDDVLVTVNDGSKEEDGSPPAAATEDEAASDPGLVGGEVVVEVGTGHEQEQLEVTTAEQQPATV
eukprot:TRINITY_DN2887_c0_g1_i3.p1 TRINITY_DN2887_c0_g1~~TRINITY_DN2887_c0_g1_i3.p1  ORF type:complete len:315 (-),score=83.90 TRINITY_DN2887_c0_g1_i3:78-1022(-)